LQLNKAQVRYTTKASLHACAGMASEVENLNIDAAKLQTSTNMGDSGETEKKYRLNTGLGGIKFVRTYFELNLGL